MIEEKHIRYIRRTIITTPLSLLISSLIPGIGAVCSLLHAL